MSATMHAELVTIIHFLLVRREDQLPGDCCISRWADPAFVAGRSATTMAVGRMSGGRHAFPGGTCRPPFCSRALTRSGGWG